MKYVIGIDLGTTHCSMAYTLLEQKDHEEKEIVQFQIPQFIDAGLLDKRPLLPSFLYIPFDQELEAGSMELPWDKESQICVGYYALKRSQDLPERVIGSAKSWLACEAIDRRSALLPQKASKEVLTFSPVQVSAFYLKHLKEAWDDQFSEDAFCDQKIYITVPASFDPAARELVQEAAKEANFPHFVLLEEPQAAFYAWLHHRGKQWRSELQVGDCILVVDIGGGTTDFSLIDVKENSGDLLLERRLVGTHLLLGGDNMDLSLAHWVKEKFRKNGDVLDHWQFQQLIYACRSLKERLSSAGFDDDKARIHVEGRGSGLIGASLCVDISLKELTQFLLEGFFPLVDKKDQAVMQKKLGIRQFGLPYAQDPRITSQLAKFLSQTGESEKMSLDEFQLPTKIFFNGGCMKSASFRQRVVDLLTTWQEEAKEKILILENQNLDCSVSQGAVYYGLSCLGKAVRIKAGANYSYFIGVEDALPSIPGVEPQIRALCIVPQGMEEGTEEKIKEQSFTLVLGELATFRFFCRSTKKLSTGEEVFSGMWVDHWEEELQELHPLELVLKKMDTGEFYVQVTLEVKYTELGILEVWCLGDSGRKWKLEFDLRKEDAQQMLKV